MKIVALKQTLSKEIVATSTMFVLAWDATKSSFKIDLVKKINGRPFMIPAVVYARLRTNTNSAALKTFALKSPLWRPMFDSNNKQFHRPGWLDECLFLEAETVQEVVNAVFELAEDNLSLIANTSTVLLFPGGLVNG